MPVPTAYEVRNASEFYTAVDGEQFGNVHRTGVIDGCAVTESASDMDVTVGAGTALVDGAVVAVAGDTVTISSDPSNLRWCIVYVDDAGGIQVAAGDPAPDDQTEPSKPSVSGAILKEYKVQAGQTIAANVGVAIDKALQTHPQVFPMVCTSQLTANQNTTLANVTGLAFPVGANEVWAASFDLQTASNASGGLQFRFTIPSGATATGYRAAFGASAVAAGRVSNFTTPTGNSAAIVAVRLQVYVVNGATAGTVQLQAAQNAYHSSDSIVYVGSSGVAWRTA